MAIHSFSDGCVGQNWSHVRSLRFQAAMTAAGLRDVRVLPDLARIRAEVPDFSVAAIGATRPAGG